MQALDALVCVEPGKLAFADLPTPRKPDGYVSVRPRRIGICGTDYHIFEGLHPFVKYPRIM
jgi:threonine dehydrogenase-like Zn-dependent dehydrogenase